MKGKGVEIDRGCNSRPTPALVRKKWLWRTVILCFSALPISPGRTDLWSTQDVASWREGRTMERRLKKEKEEEWSKENMVKNQKKARKEAEKCSVGKYN